MTYERHAYWCQHKSHENDAVPLRVFIGADDPVPNCPAGHGKMKRQRNNTYFGEPVEDAPKPPPEPEAA